MQQSTIIRRARFVDLNVLPEELRPRQDPVWYFAGAVVVLAIGLLLFPLNRAKAGIDAETARLRSELQMKNEELGQIQVDFGKARELRQELEGTEAAIIALDEERGAILGGGQRPSADLLAMMSALPPGADVASVTASEGLLLLQGRAGQGADVLAYARALVGSGRFSEARIASLTLESGREEGTGITFAIQVARKTEGS